jgi:ligand-binding sensor domain-containing protein
MRNRLAINRTALTALQHAALIGLFASFAFGQRLPIRLFTSTDGLSSSIIHHIARDSKGFLWFCARGGLSRYDGEQFTSYRLTEDPSSAPVVNYFLETRDGTFWIATDSGLFRIHPDAPVETKPLDHATSGEHYLNAIKVSDIGFWSLYEDRDGRLWGGMTALYLIENRDLEKVTPVRVDFASSAAESTNAEIRSFAEAPDGSVWIGFRGGVARRLPDGRYVLYRVPRISKLQHTLALRIDAAGRVWISNSTGVFVFKPAPIESLTTTVVDLPLHTVTLGKIGIVELPDDPTTMLKLTIEGGHGEQLATTIVHDLYVDSDERVWVPSRHGLFLFSGNSYERLLDPAGKLEVSTSIEEDLAGRIWFGSPIGAFRYSSDGLITYDELTGVPDPEVHSIQQTASGDLVVIHGNWQITRITREGVFSTQLEMPEASRHLWTARPIFLDRDENLWALSLEGLFKARKNSLPERVEASEFGRSDRSFYRAFPAADGKIWFATRGEEGSALYLHDPVKNSWQEMSGLPGYPAGGAVSAVARSADGVYWFGIYRRPNLYKLVGDQFVEIPLPVQTAGSSAFGLRFDPSGRLWVATSGGGIVRLDHPAESDPGYKVYTEAVGLSSNNVRCLTLGPDGAVYAGTIRGVSRRCSLCGNYPRRQSDRSDHGCDSPDHDCRRTRSGFRSRRFYS